MPDWVWGISRVFLLHVQEWCNAQDQYEQSLLTNDEKKQCLKLYDVIFLVLKCRGFSKESVSRSVKNKSRKREITQKTTQPEKKLHPKDIY